MKAELELLREISNEALKMWDNGGLGLKRNILKDLLADYIDLAGLDDITKIKTKPCPTCNKKIRVKDRFEASNDKDEGFLKPCSGCKNRYSNWDVMPCRFCISHILQHREERDD